MYFAIITNYTSTFAMELSVNDEITGKLQNHSFMSSIKSYFTDNKNKI